jgi:hypothetical protein
MRRLSTGWSNLLPCSHALTSAIELNSFCNLREDFMMADQRNSVDDQLKISSLLTFFAGIPP